jgi:hypothetical protein
MTKFRMKLAVIAGSAVSLVALVVPAIAGATADTTLTDAKTSATNYFTANIATVVGGFIAVAASLWLLTMLFNSIGVRRKRSI